MRPSDDVSALACDGLESRAVPVRQAPEVEGDHHALGKNRSCCAGQEVGHRWLIPQGSGPRFGSSTPSKGSGRESKTNTEVFRGGTQAGWTGGLAPAALFSGKGGVWGELCPWAVPFFLRSSLALSSSPLAPCAPPGAALLVSASVERAPVCRCTTS